MTSRVFLVGFMGSGKSSLGRVLAGQLNYEFLDLDDWIENQSGRSITELFSTLGEAGFRELESNTLRDLHTKDNIVVSCGGGTPCHDQNMDWMNENGITIFLNTHIDLLFLRLEPQKSHRPLIAKMSSKRLKGYIESKLMERFPYYSKAQIELIALDSIENSVKFLRTVL